MAFENYSNKTLFGIKNETERCAWAGYFLFVLLSSLIGDTTILVTSIKHRAFRLHKLIIVVIQHIAVCDLLVVSIASVVPRLISMFADGAALGQWIGNIQAYAEYYFSVVGMYLISVMTSSKLFILYYPLRAKSLNPKHAHIGCAAVWALVISLPIIILAIDKNDVVFSYQDYTYSFAYSSASWNWLRPVLAVILMVVPNMFVIFTTVLLVVYLIKARGIARQSRGAVRWHGIITTILTAVIYCISILPFAIYNAFESKVSNQSSFFHKGFNRIAVSCIYFNTISNFYIYILTVPSFRNFVWSQICQSYQWLSNNAFTYGEYFYLIWNLIINDTLLPSHYTYNRSTES